MWSKISKDLSEHFIKSLTDIVALKEPGNRAGMRRYDFMHSFNEIWLSELFCYASWSS